MKPLHPNLLRTLTAARRASEQLQARIKAENARHQPTTPARRPSMTTEHTPGRLFYQDDSDAYTHFLRDESGHRIVAAAPQSSLPHHKANMRRLAACWNACTGVNTEVLETAGTRHDWADLMQELENERDELLQALRDLLDATPIPSSVCKERPAYEAAVAMLAKHQPT